MNEFGDLLTAVGLGIVQAATEFLPVSSSGHLVIVSEAIGSDVSSLTFDIGLHVGTTLAVLLYFWRDWQRIVTAATSDFRRHGPWVSRWSAHARLGVWIALATTPVMFVGPLFTGVVDSRMREPWVAGLMLIVFGGIIGALDRWGARVIGLTDLTASRAITIGLAQAVALVPGVSRSGITIAVARGLGVERPAAVRFSFLLSMPVVFGAGLLRTVETFTSDEVLQWVHCWWGLLRRQSSEDS